MGDDTGFGVPKHHEYELKLSSSAYLRMADSLAAPTIDGTFRNTNTDYSQTLP